MTPFSEVWTFTDSIPGSFTETSARELYRYACEVTDGGVIVEVGVDQGRSASLLMAAAEQNHADVYLFDSWESVLIANIEKLKTMLVYFKHEPFVMCASSVEAAHWFSLPIDLIHIDANHYAPNPENDCESWLPKVKSGGVACFHDYDSCFPDVNVAIDKHCSGWEDLGVHDGLAIRRKP